MIRRHYCVSHSLVVKRWEMDSVYVRPSGTVNGLGVVNWQVFVANLDPSPLLLKCRSYVGVPSQL